MYACARVFCVTACATRTCDCRETSTVCVKDWKWLHGRFAIPTRSATGSTVCCPSWTVTVVDRRLAMRVCSTGACRLGHRAATWHQDDVQFVADVGDGLNYFITSLCAIVDVARMAS